MDSVIQQRLHNQLLADKHFTTAEDTVRWMGAVQGQDYYPTLWALAQRLPSLTKEAIEQEIQALRIVRTWAFRHTIHFVALDDLTWILELSKERMLNQWTNHIEKQHGLTAMILDQAHAVFEEALKGKQLISRPVMREILEDTGIDTTGQRYYNLIWHAAQSGLIFIGPMEDKQQTFGLVKEWAPESPFTSREDALKELARRYLQSHGPATDRDFAWWAGLTLTDARRAIALAEDTVHYEVPSILLPSLYLIESLDEYIMAYKDRSDILSEEMKTWIDPQNRGIYHPILYNGKVAGNWKVNKKKAAVNNIEYTICPGIRIEDQLLETKAKEYAKFFGLIYSQS